MLKYNANKPKFSGEKRRVKTGEMAIGIACATIVPAIKVITPLENLSENICLNNFLKKSIIKSAVKNHSAFNDNSLSFSLIYLVRKGIKLKKVNIGTEK
jgi:hypothetical protein